MTIKKQDHWGPILPLVVSDPNEVGLSGRAGIWITGPKGSQPNLRSEIEARQGLDWLITWWARQRNTRKVLRKELEAFPGMVSRWEIEWAGLSEVARSHIQAGLNRSLGGDSPLGLHFFSLKEAAEDALRNLPGKDSEKAISRGVLKHPEAPMKADHPDFQVCLALARWTFDATGKAPSVGHAESKSRTPFMKVLNAVIQAAQGLPKDQKGEASFPALKSIRDGAALEALKYFREQIGPPETQ